MPRDPWAFFVIIMITFIIIIISSSSHFIIHFIVVFADAVDCGAGRLLDIDVRLTSTSKHTSVEIR